MMTTIGMIQRRDWNTNFRKGRLDTIDYLYSNYVPLSRMVKSFDGIDKSFGVFFKKSPDPITTIL